MKNMESDWLGSHPVLPCGGSAGDHSIPSKDEEKIKNLPSGYVKIAIENGHRNSEPTIIKICQNIDVP